MRIALAQMKMTPEIEINFQFKSGLEIDVDA